MNLIAQMFRRKRLCDDLSEEIRQHLEEKTEELMDAGMSREQAWAAACRQFGDVTQIEEYSREVWRWRRIETILFDLRFGWRMLCKNAGFTTTVLLTLAIGIGANTAIFSVVNAVLLRPLPFPDSDRLAFLSESCRDIPEMYVSMPNLHDWQSMNTVFESIGAARKNSVTLTGRGEPERLPIREVSAEFFSTLKVKPVIGRLFREDDDHVKSAPVVLLSETFWTREFERDPRVLGMNLDLNGEAFNVIGVVPANGFRTLWHGEVDAYIPLGRQEDVIGRPEHRADHYGIYSYARLKPGITLQAARSEMSRVADQLARRYPATNVGQTIWMQPLLREEVEDVHRPLALLMGAVGLVLLIACANVANLLTSLAMVRRHEIAVRSALGAGPSRLARQFLCESILLALLGGAMGLIVAFCLTAMASESLARLPALIPRIDEVRVDPAVLLFTLTVSLLTGVAFGVFPAIVAYRADLNEVLKENNRSTVPPDVRLRSGLVATELALSLVLLVVAGLMIKSLIHVVQADPGYRVDGVLTAKVVLPPTQYKTDAERRTFVRRLTDGLAALPGVEAAGLKDPLLGPREDSFVVEDHPRPAPGSEPYTEISLVTPGAFEAMSMKLDSGRYFQSSDDENTSPVCIVDDLLAQQYWPGQSAIGKRLAIVATSSTPPVWTTIVGVVHHVENHASGGPPLPGTYFPFLQDVTNGGTLVVRSRQDPTLIVAALRGLLHFLDPDLALSDIAPLAKLTDDRVAPRRLSVALLIVLAGIAMVLAAVGTYSVMAYMVVGRRQELGLRRMLGATPRDIMRLVLGQGMRVALPGLLTGVVVALALGRVVSPMLFGVKPSDPITFAGVGALLMGVAAVACYIPAQRAMRLDPLEAVRHE